MYKHERALCHKKHDQIRRIKREKLTSPHDSSSLFPPPLS
jgi:hypothetical protein